MNAAFAPLLLVVVLIVAATAGSHLIRAASPLLMRAPRTAVALLSGSLLLWVSAFAALSLMLAWLVTGPRLLPDPLNDVCERCLAAASPFGAPATLNTSVPVALLLLAPAIALVIVIGLAAFLSFRRGRRTRALAEAVRRRATRTQVAGHDVMLLPDERAIAYSLPHSRGGIVISAGLCSTLGEIELTAVLEHESAHIRQRHHLILAALEAVTWPLRWIPLVRSIRDAVPHYLEIASDNRARRCTGTPALASALLKLADSHPALGSASAAAALHAAGPERIRQLVAPATIRSALLPVAAFGTMLAAFAVVTAAVHGPYLYVILTGCHLEV